MPQISALFLHDHKLISYRRKFIQILQSGFGAINLLHPNLLWTKATAQSHRIQQVGQARDHHLDPPSVMPQYRPTQAQTAGMAGDPSGKNWRANLAQNGKTLAMLPRRICGWRGGGTW